MCKKNIFLILNDSGFPLRISAPANKYLLMAKGLLYENYHVVLLNRYNLIRDLEDAHGDIEGIEYRFLSGKKKLSNTFSKIIGFIKSQFRLIFYLKENKEKYENRYLMITYNHLIIVIYYRIITKLFGYKLIMSVMEYNSSIERNLSGRIKAYLFEKFAFHFVDGALPISQYLINLIKKSNKKLPIFKLPAIADFSLSSIEKVNCIEIPDEKYFLYCGNIGYRVIIDLVVQSFIKLNHNGFSLILVLSGSKNDIENYKYEIHALKDIEIVTNVPYSKLFALYKNALSLLVPLRNNLQDKARFPQKIPEYLSSRTSIISNNIGEVAYYFQQYENVIIAKDFTVKSYVESMEYVINNPEKAKKIGEEGYKLGVNKFDYKIVSNGLSEYLTLL